MTCTVLRDAELDQTSACLWHAHIAELLLQARVSQELDLLLDLLQL